MIKNYIQAAFLSAAAIYIITISEWWSFPISMVLWMFAIHYIKAAFKESKIIHNRHTISLKFYDRTLEEVKSAISDIISKTNIKVLACNIYKDKRDNSRIAMLEFETKKDANDAADNPILKEIYSQWVTPEGAEIEDVDITKGGK